MKEKKLANYRELLKVYQSQLELAETNNERFKIEDEIYKIEGEIAQLERQTGSKPQPKLQKEPQTDPKSISFFKPFMIVTVVLAVMIVILDLVESQLLHPYTWGIWGYCALLSLGTFLIASKGVNRPDFANYFTGATTVRLLLTLAILGAYLYAFHDPQGTRFALTFIICYFIYVGLEIQMLVKAIRK